MDSSNIPFNPTPPSRIDGKVGTVSREESVQQ